MERNVLELIIYLSIIYVIKSEQCTVRDKRMDCENKGLSDCPDYNPSVTELIMDNNKLTTLKTSKCEKWTNLRIFSANNNRIVNLGNNITASSLMELYVAHNSLSSVYLFGEMLINVDLSYNKMEDIQIERISTLSTLILAHNNIELSSIKKLLYDQRMPSLTVIDLSYNNLASIPINFMSFFPSFLSEVNLAGNRFSIVYFTLFCYKSHDPIKLNLSHNQISTLILDSPPTLTSVDLSHNQLAYIDLPSLTILNSGPEIDLSNNPFKCSCKSLPPFVVYMHNNRDSFVHKSETLCSKGLNIFDYHCLSSSSQSSLRSFPWVFPAVAVASVAVILLIVLIAIRHRRKAYIELTSPGDHCSGISAISSLYNYWLTPSNTIAINDRTSSNTEIVIPEQSVHLDDKLVILCSSKDKKWVSKEIVSYLTIPTDLSVSRMSEVPSCDYVLIVVNGNGSLKDATLLKNVALILNAAEQFEIRLLIRSMPTTELLKLRNCMTNYIHDKTSVGSYFKFEDDYPLTCIDSMKAWLNIEA